MGAVGKSVNKALLPLSFQAIISHIISKFAKDSRFVIAVGDRAKQVQSYLEIAHPDLEFVFVDVDKLDGPGSGPGYSLLCCEAALQEPFFVVTSDTLWTAPLALKNQTNWIGVANIPQCEADQYCTVHTDQDQKIFFLEKKPCLEMQAAQAFVGLCHIQDYKVFWQGLRNQRDTTEELQISAGLRALCETRNVDLQEVDWLDVGKEDKYLKAAAVAGQYDFSKADQVLYILQGRVIKFFADADIAQARVQRAKIMESKGQAFPKIAAQRDHFFSYPWISGQTLYQFLAEQKTAGIFKEFLVWMDAAVWDKKIAQCPPSVFQQACLSFYLQKTMQRVSLYLQKHPHSAGPDRINGVSVPAVEMQIQSMNWQDLARGIPVFMHGDLQFDNIIYESKKNLFTLIDWREGFSGLLEVGDLYYDLAKLLAGILLPYDRVKNLEFGIRFNANEIQMCIPEAPLKAACIEILKDFIQSKGLDWNRIELLSGLVFLNMAPLHKEPFDQFLFAMGRLIIGSKVYGTEKASAEATA